MTKSDLKNGMVVTCRNGNRYMVMLSASIRNSSCESICCAIDDCANWIRFANYNDNLIHSLNSEWDIVKVDELNYKMDIAKFFRDSDDVSYHTIWIRSEKKKYTYEQIKEILGEEFEIAKE